MNQVPTPSSLLLLTIGLALLISGRRLKEGKGQASHSPLLL